MLVYDYEAHRKIEEQSRSISVARSAAKRNSSFRPPPFADVTLSDIEEAAPESSLIVVSENEI